MKENKLIELFKSNPRLSQGNLQIIACAGSGKTEFVSTRIAYMISEKIAKPENIVAFTFTEKAATELKLRIRQKILEINGKPSDIGDIYVGTIHGFCFNLLKEYISGFRGYDVLDEGKRYAFISSIRNDLKLYLLKNWLKGKGKKKFFAKTEESWAINNFIDGYDKVREEMIDVKDVSDCEYFIEACDIYQQRLNEKKFLDFSGIMDLTVKALQQDENLLKKIREKYKYITVDEYQDINPIQEKIIKLLSGDNGNLCVVGDDDQSIYQWRGADINNILKFKNRYKNVHIYPLPINFRSTDKIVELANELIQHNKKRLPKSMKFSGKISGIGDIYKVEFDNQEEEAIFIANKIKELIGTEYVDNSGKKRGLTYADFAIFFRSVAYDAKPYLEILDNKDIKYAVSGIGGLFDSIEVKVIYQILAYLSDFSINKVKNNWVPPIIEDLADFAIKVFKNISKKKFINNFQELKKEIKKTKRLFLQGLYLNILDLLGINEESYHNPDFELEMYNLGRLSQAISDYEATRTYCTYRDIEGFCWFIKNYAEGSYDAGSGEDPTYSVNAVQIITLHSTKGLGFPVVFMPKCIDKEPRDISTGFLNPKKFDFKRYIGTLEDERRLFYVGITRAKKYLFVSSLRHKGKKNTFCNTSCFFDEINPKYCLCKPAPDPTKKEKIKPELSVENAIFPTNYSELSDYIRCEYDYKLRYIYNFNPVLVQALGYGRQIHNILNLLHNHVQKTGKTPNEKQILNVIDDHFYLRYAAESQQKKLKKSASKCVKKYMKMWEQDLSLSVRSERPFEMAVDNALINGTIDLLKRKEEKSDILEIIDFKTGQKKLTEELGLQVQLYTFAGREVLNLDVHKAYVHYLDDDKQQRVEILVTSTQLDLAMNTVKDSVKGITNRRFGRNPKSKHTCITCDWNKICPKKN
ncbi:MAG: ATP-dependent DNA helicase [Candidatus Firestonebacteria bacterium]